MIDPHIAYKEFLENHRISLVPNGCVLGMSPKVSFVIPLMGDSHLDNLLVAIRCIRAQTVPSEIIISEEGETPIDFNFDGGIRRLFMEYSGAFRRSATLNNGARNATTDIIITLDTDILFPIDYAERVINATKYYDGGTLIRYCHHASEEDSISIRRYLDVSTIKGKSIGMWPECHGCTGFVKKDVFLDIGGYSESYIGYGSEDSDFINTLCTKARIYLPREIDVLHLYHDKSTAGWDKNVEKYLAKWSGVEINLPWGKV